MKSSIHRHVASLDSSEELKEAQRLAHIGSWYWDARTDVTIGSDELLRIYGFDPATQTIPHFQDQRGLCYPQEDWEKINAAARNALETGVGYVLDVRAFRHNTPIWVTTRSEVVRDSQGQVVGLRGTVHDITERKRAELALENSEKQLRFVLQGSELGFWDWDIAAGTVERNARWAEMLGYTHSEIQQTTMQWTDFIHPDDRDRAWSSIHAVLEGRSNIHRIEYRMLHKDGSIRWILDQASVMQHDAHGKPSRMCGTHTDITGIKHTEEVLRNSEARFRVIIEASPIPMALNDDAGSISYLNSAFTRTFGYTMDDIPTLADWWAKAYPDASYSLRG